MIKIFQVRASQNEVDQFLGKPFSEMVKFVADVRKGILALGGELHADAEALLLEQGSRQEDLWGGNFYPKRDKENQVEYHSMINIRPGVGNRGTEIQDDNIRKQVSEVLEKILL